MSDICGDNRFELIKKYKQMLIENTNIEMAKDEMAVIDNILFRFWQMNWLDKLEQMPSAQPEKRTEERTETHGVCLDAIDRQVAIDTLMEILDRPNHAEFLYTDEICKALKALPSAQPVGTPLHYNGSDYAHGFADGYKQGLKDAESERVRCKDCLYWVAHDKRCVYLNHGFAPNMWCCHGRRADE